MTEKLTKSAVVAAIHEQCPVSQKDIQAIIDLFFEHLKEALQEGREAEFRGFGTFEVRQRAGRKKARNPKTGDHVSVPPHAVVAFRPGRDLRQAVWELRIEE